MRRLTLIRHAKSDWTSGAESDHARPLNARGRRDAPEMGRRLKKRGLRFDLILASDAVRAQETIALIRAELPADDQGRLLNDSDLYLAGAEDMLALVMSQPDEVQDLALVGHNPGMTCLSMRLGADLENLPTCGIVTLNFETARTWADIGDHPADVVEVDLPKMPWRG